MRFHRTKHIATVLPLLLGAVLSLGAQTTPASLKDSFANPPHDARPSVWWHWMYGNATVDGVRKDIRWMDRAGIGGFSVIGGHNHALFYHVLIPDDGGIQM